MAITIPIFADFNDRGLRDAEGAFESFGKKVGGIAKAAAAAVAGIGIAAVAGAKQAIDAASDLAESQAKVGQIFGDSAAQVEAFAATAAKKFGQSKQDVLNAAGVFGTFGKAAGLSGKELADFSNDFTGLASDLASFNNTTPQEAIDAIGAALRGEAEPLRRYGVLLDDAALKAEALTLGIYNGKGALTQEQKILAAQAAIYKQTADAQGDFARTSGGLANQQRILKAQLANATATLGEKLLPIAVKVASFIGEKFIPIIEKVSQAFSEGGFSGIANLIKDQLPAIKTALGNIADGIFSWVRETAPKVLNALGELGKKFLEWIGPRIGPMLQQLGELIGKAANWIIDEGIPLLTDKLIELGNALVDWIKPRIVPMLEQLGEWLAKLLQWIVTDALPKLTAQALKLAGALLSWLGELAPKAIVGLAKFVGELLSKLPGIFVDLIKWMGQLGIDLGQAILNGIVDTVKKLVDKGGEIARGLVNAILDFVNKQFINRINDLLEFTISTPIGSLTIDPPDIPNIPLLLGDGGIVTGPTLAMIGERGPEAVIPLNRGMMGNVTVNVSGSVISEGDLIERVRKGLVNAQRNGSGLVYSNS